MKPQTISEQLLFNTVKLLASDGSSGTGFFYNFDVNGKIYPTIITNKHVVNYNSTETMTFYIANDKSIIATRPKLETLSALEELVMVGYPIGLWDSKNNLPIFRRGYTASHPAIDFNENGIGVVDMACFPGSSGSPIYILNENGYSDKNGNTYLGAKRIILIGILYAGPQYNAQGELIVTTIPTKQKVQTATPIMTNLGYYIKANELQEFHEYIKNYV